MDFSSPQALAALVAGLVAVLTSVLTAIVTLRISKRKAELDFKTEFAAERVAHELMMDPDWRWRSFEVIRHHLGGFEDNELRKILVRAGAIRVESRQGKELWGLLDRNRDNIGVVKLPTDPGYKDVLP